MNFCGNLPNMGNPPHPPNNLKPLRVAKGWTQAQMADQLGMSEKGYIKIERSERGLKLDRLRLAADKLEVDESAIIDRRLIVDDDDQAAETEDQQVSAAVPANRAFSFKTVVGEMSAGVYRDAELFEDDLGEMISAPPSVRFPWARQKAWLVEGDSMNEAEPKPINHGDYVIGLAYEDIQEEVPLRNGLNVIVKRTRDNGQSFEVTVKELHVLDEKFEFRPRSTNKKHKSFFVNKDFKADDGTIVEIDAIVQFVFDSHEAQF